MDIKEYIESDSPFYHITAIEKRESILKNGLKNLGQRLGICVVRSDDIRIINHIASTQLIADLPSEKYCVFKIIPSKHKILFNEIKPDTTHYEETNVLHNYIIKKLIEVDQDDIFIEEKHIYNDNINNLKETLNKENLLIELTYLEK